MYYKSLSKLLQDNKQPKPIYMNRLPKQEIKKTTAIQYITLFIISMIDISVGLCALAVYVCIGAICTIIGMFCLFLFLKNTITQV